ncbi:MAG TPA: RsmB/NOP family class I SAM-dependent RNA methyltransferase [Planctomycetota bacterium]|nr:RsmB/NOP family class I SAM-dependent RNA methyltransferase [Planctomycetota bacterium]
MNREHEIILELWRRVSDGWGFSTTAIAVAFKREHLDDAQKREIVETLHDMIAFYRRFDFALQNEASEPSARALLAAALLHAGKIDAHAAQEFAREVDWDAAARADERIAQIADPVRRFAVTHSLTDSFAARLLAEYSAEARELAAALNLRAPATLRANTLKNSRDELIAALAAEGIAARETQFSPTGVVVENPARLFATNAFASGLFEAQDEGSQLIAELAAPARGSSVLDACAGSGGKSLALSALMGGTGTLPALDISESRLRELRRRARRASAHNIRALRTETDTWPPEILARSGKFQRVLVDAPCGGSGALRRNPEARWRGDGALEELPRIQESLARRALELCAKNGRVIYATCSIFRAENEGVVERVLSDGGCECVPIKEILSRARADLIASPCGRFLKLLPYRHGTDGFFAAVLRKR